MPWLQLILETDRQYLQEIIEEVLLNAGALAVTFQSDSALEGGVDPRAPLLFRIIGLFDAQADMEKVQRYLQSLLGRDTLLRSHVEVLEDQDWVRAWMKDFHPMKFGSRLWICPSETVPPDPAAVNILLDPGLGFGTGTHPTTSLCLEWLEKQDLNGLEVIDYGCGSGILAIAAAKLGARHVWAVDNDPLALQATEDNLRRNEVHRIVHPVSPELLPEIQADLLVSNILAQMIISLAPLFAKQVREGGRIALSGVLQDQEEGVQDVYKRWFAFKEKVVRQGWLLMEGIRLPDARWVCDIKVGKN